MKLKLQKTKLKYQFYVSVYRLGYEKVAEVLIGKGANISAETKRSSTPLHLAAESGWI